MDSIYKLQQRASALRNKTQIDSITPEEVGGLHNDTLAYIADMEQNLDGLGIRKVYVSVAAMENDKTAPIGTNGKPLRLGQLVTIYNASAPAVGTGNVYAFQKPGWLLIGNISDISELKALVEIEATARELADNNLEMQLTHLNSGCIYRGYVNEGTTLPSDDNSFYLTNSPTNYIDREGNVVSVTTEGVSLIQRKNGVWKVYALWELVSELNNASKTRFASSYAVKKLKDMIDQLAARGGNGGGTGNITIDSELSETSLNPVQNVVITAAINELNRAIAMVKGKNSVITEMIANYSVTENKLSTDLSDKINNTKVVADKAAADIGVDSITLLQGGINSDGSENTSSYYLRTGRYSPFKLEVNSGYTIGQLAQYDLGGNFVALYSDYTQALEGVKWTPTSVVATDKDYYWVAIVFKGNSPTDDIYPQENVIKTFISGLYYYMQGKEDDVNSAAAQAKKIVNGTVDPLINRILKLEQDVFPLEVILDIKESSVQEYTGANENFTISWTTKIDGESVTPSDLVLTVGETIVETDVNKTSVTVAANDDRKVELSVKAKGRSAKAEGNIKFAYPAYTGLVDDDFDILESNITTELTKMPLVDGRSRTYTYAAHSNKKIIYCYASVYGNLSQVIGPANTNFIHLFDKQNVNINNIAYNVYIYKKINSTEGSLTYNYK